MDKDRSGSDTHMEEILVPEVEIIPNEDLLPSTGYEEDPEMKELRRLEQGFNECIKNPGHVNFIPVNAFSREHLPPELRSQENIMDMIRDKINRTVRVKVLYTSKHRPDTFWGCKSPYTHATYRGMETVRYGTGTVNLFFHQPTESTTLCTCFECRKPGSVPKMAKYLVTVLTSTHVIFNNEEANNAIFDLFFDSEGETPGRFRLYGLHTSDSNPSPLENYRTDYCEVVCVTHDEETAEKLTQTVFSNTSLNSVPENGIFSISSRNFGVPGVLVSHPHGCSKRITIGEVLCVIVPTEQEETGNINFLPLETKCRLYNNKPNEERSGNESSQSHRTKKTQVAGMSDSNNVVPPIVDENVLSPIAGVGVQNKANDISKDSMGLPERSSVMSCHGDGLFTADLSEYCCFTEPGKKRDLENQEAPPLVVLVGRLYSPMSESMDIEETKADLDAFFKSEIFKNSLGDILQKSESDGDVVEIIGEELPSDLSNCNSDIIDFDLNNQADRDFLVDMVHKSTALSLNAPCSQMVTQVIHDGASEEFTEAIMSESLPNFKLSLESLCNSVMVKENIAAEPQNLSSPTTTTTTIIEIRPRTTYTLPKGATFVVRYNRKNPGWFRFPKGTKFKNFKGEELPIPDGSEFKSPLYIPERCRAIYTTDTCSGSSGARICTDLVSSDSDRKMVHLTHTCSVLNSKNNCSGLEGQRLYPALGTLTPVSVDFLDSRI